MTHRGRQLTEEGLILTDRLAFVVKDRPAAADPTWRADDTADFLWLGLTLFQDLAAEAIRIGKAELNLERRQRVAGVGFTGKSRSIRRQPFRRILRICSLGALKAIEVVDDTRRGVLQQGWCGAVRVCAVVQSVDLNLRQIGREAGQRVTGYRCWQGLAHDGCARHHAQRIEGNRRLVAIRVAHQARLEHAIVMGSHGNAIVQRIAALHHQ